MRKLPAGFLSLAFTLAFLTSAHAKVVYVNAAIATSGNGLTWATAKKTVQDGLNTAVSGDQVWVAAGTYVQCITLTSGVELYGGFTGSENQLSQRNWVTNVAILDGNASSSVVTAPSGATSSTRIDGFMILNGAGTFYNLGGGIYCSHSSPVISNNTITRNTTTSGGGIYCDSSSPTISNNIIMGNTVDGGSGSGGGGIYCYSGSPAICNNTISCNTANAPGGGIYCSSSSPTISNNIIAFNSSGLYNWSGTPGLRNNCVYNPAGANYTGLSAGTEDFSVDPQLVAPEYGQIHLRASSPCINSGYDAVVQPGWLDLDGQTRIQGTRVDIGVDEFNGSTPPFTLKVVRVSASGNNANNGSSWDLAKRTVQAAIDAAAISGGEVWTEAGTYNERIVLKTWTHVYGGFGGAESSRDQRNWVTHVTTLDGGATGSVVAACAPGYRSSTLDGFAIRNGTNSGIHCFSSSPVIANNTITSNSYGGISIYDCSPIVSGNTITNNIATWGGGVYCSKSPAVISNNNITRNTGSPGGGGICCSYASPIIFNNTITANQATDGGGIYCRASSPTVSSNTIIRNSATSGNGGGIYCSAQSEINNNIVAFNSSGLYNSGGTPTLHNNCIYNPGSANYSGLSPGIGDISADPRVPGSEVGQVHLDVSSPCINSGYDAAVLAGALDIDGQPRIQDTHVDIGADEFNGVAPPFTLRVVRVSASGNNANDGSTWASAKRTLQAGIDFASITGGEVWVAAGTYSERITIKLWTHVYGGFKGNESGRDERRWLTNLTILDGAAGGSVVTVLSPGYCSSTVDGFTIRNGTGTLSGGNLCGGGIYCNGSSPEISNNTITGNTARYGAGVWCPSAAISSNTITANVASSSGGGIYSSGAGVIFNNAIRGNSAVGGSSFYEGGGGIFTSTSLIWNNTVRENTSAQGHGGGIHCFSSATIFNNSVADNTSADGGGIYSHSDSPVLSSNIVAFNSSGISRYDQTAKPTLRNNCIYNPAGANYAGLSPGLGDVSMDPLFINRQSGDYHLRMTSPCIDAGYNAAVPGGTLLDLDGQSRFFDTPETSDCRWAPGSCGAAPIVDMGAYEFIPVYYGDSDGDLDVDQVDFGHFQACMGDRGQWPIISGCTNTDLDGDGDVDATDVDVFLRCFAGPEVIVDPSCAK